jgi:hypothetical protein
MPANQRKTFRAPSLNTLGETIIIIAAHKKNKNMWIQTQSKLEQWSALWSSVIMQNDLNEE